MLVKEKRIVIYANIVSICIVIWMHYRFYGSDDYAYTSSTAHGTSHDTEDVRDEYEGSMSSNRGGHWDVGHMVRTISIVICNEGI